MLRTLFTMGRRKKGKEERAGFVQGGGNLTKLVNDLCPVKKMAATQSNDEKVSVPFPMACINWAQGCKYKTPRGVPTEEQVLHLLDLHKRLCEKTKVGGSSPHGFLKPSPSENCVEKRFGGGEKFDPVGDDALQGVNSEQASFETGNEFVELEMDFKGTYEGPEHEVGAKSFNDLTSSKVSEMQIEECKSEKYCEGLDDISDQNDLANTASGRHIRVEESSLGEKEDLEGALVEPNLLNKNKLREQLKTKAKYIEDLKLDIAQCVDWSPKRRRLEELNLGLLQSQLYQWMSRLQAQPPKVIVKPLISAPMLLTSASEDDCDTFDLPICEGLGVPGENIESKVKGRQKEGNGDKDDPEDNGDIKKEETRPEYKHERNDMLGPIFCVRCDFSCVQAEAFKKHMSSHKQNDLLSGKNFTQVGIKLKTRMLLHSGEMKFICKYCDKTFAQKGSLKRHLISHTGAKPYKCNQCALSYCQPQDLKYHVLTQHTAGKPNLKRYTCDKCDSSFIRSSEKKRHLLIHSGERPFRCEVCGYTCGRINQLNTHALIHSDTKPFMCKKCNYTSTQASNLKRHMNLHAETPFLSC